VTTVATTARWSSGMNWLHGHLFKPSYPLVAIEVRARSVGAVRVVRERGRLRLAAAACLELPEGVLRLSMVEPNVMDAAAFRSVLASALERAGGLASGRVALVLPDPVARVAVFPAGGGEGAGTDPEEMLRFRLRKSVPFEIREARVASLPLPVAGGEPSILAGAIFRPVLQGYEAACESLGLHAGLVELTGLALHEAITRGRPVADRLLVNWDEGYVSLVLSRAGVPILVRTLTGEPASRGEDVAREAANTILYYRERLGGAGLAGVALRSASWPPAQAVALFEESLGQAPEIVDPWAGVGVAAEQLDAAQALAGAIACVAARSA